MKTIEYDKDGEAIADEYCEQRALSFMSSDIQYLKVSTGLFIEMVRALVIERKVPHDQVQFLFKGQVIPVASNGRVNTRPHGFCDTVDDVLCRVLGVSDYENSNP